MGAALEPGTEIFASSFDREALETQLAQADRTREPASS